MSVRMRRTLMKGSGKDKGEILDYCRAAALLPVIHTMYSGRIFEVASWEESDLEEVRKVWAEMAYMVAEWCKADQIRISNVYTVVPAYFNVETPTGQAYILGLDLMCGEMVDLGRILDITVHDNRMDLLLADSQISLLIDRSENGFPLKDMIEYCMGQFDLDKALPPVRTDDITEAMREVFSNTTFIYNVSGRPLTARGISDLVGCPIDDVVDLLESSSGEITRERMATGEYTEGGYKVTQDEVLLYNFSQARVNLVAEALGLPPTSVRVVPSYKPTDRKRPLTPVDGQMKYSCDGQVRSLAMWSLRLDVPVDILKRTWRPGFTEEEWQATGHKLVGGIREQLPMWVKG